MATCLFFNFAELCKVSARLDDIDIGHFIRIFGRLKNKKNTSKGGTLVIHFDSDYILEAIVYIAIKVSIRPVYHNVNNICFEPCPFGLIKRLDPVVVIFFKKCQKNYKCWIKCILKKITTTGSANTCIFFWK